VLKVVTARGPPTTMAHESRDALVAFAGALHVAHDA